MLERLLHTRQDMPQSQAHLRQDCRWTKKGFRITLYREIKTRQAVTQRTELRKLSSVDLSKYALTKRKSEWNYGRPNVARVGSFVRRRRQRLFSRSNPSAFGISYALGYYSIVSFAYTVTSSHWKMRSDWLLRCRLIQSVKAFRLYIALMRKLFQRLPVE